MSDSLFKNGERVRLRVDPSTIGKVDGDPVSYGAGWTYTVFFSGTDTRNVAESGLEAAPADTQVALLTRDEFLRALLLTKLSSPLSNFLYAFQASRTQFEPYQFKPVFKYLDAPVPGILIADEVGLGKTIEAAILYQELKARQAVNRVLIVCPAGLRKKWQLELITRFDEKFSILDRKAILEDIRLYRETSGAQPLFAITGLETIRGREIIEALETDPVPYDMVIIDEAHHLRTAGRLSNRIGELLSELTENLVLLTATPLQTSQMDLFNLLRFIDEPQFQQFSDFELQLQPNAVLNAAIRALRRIPPALQEARSLLEGIGRLQAGAQVTNHPAFGPTMRALAGHELARGEVVTLQRDIDRMNVMSAIYTRTRKRDVAGVAKRQAFVIQVAITTQEQAFYDAALADARAQARLKAKNGSIPGFIGMMRERQAASCMSATREYLADLRRSPKASIGLEDSSTDVEPDGAPGADKGGSDAQSASAQLLQASANLGTIDSKFEAFIRALGEALSVSSGSKVIVFSYFRRTLAYLDRQLRARGYELIQINGDVTPDKRAILIDRFKGDPKLQIMLTSEVGAEGLDFQFCDTLFNYDLPWNPMRVEQRIGRIDRYGQLQPKIRIYSFFLAGTIEERILERLYLRIGIFEDSIGDLEPILGPLASDMTKEIFAAELTPEEEIEVANRYADLVLHRRAEEQDLESRSAELLGQDSVILQAIDDTVSSGRYISTAELRAMVGGFLNELGGMAELEDTVGDGTAFVRSSDKVLRAVEDLMSRQRDSRSTAVGFVAKLRGTGRIPVTFDGQTAMSRPRLELLNLSHPLVRTAVEHYRATPQVRMPMVDLTVAATTAPVASGTYVFGLFLLNIRGAQTQTRLIPIAIEPGGRRSEALEERLLWLIQEAAADGTVRPWTAAERDEVVAATTRIAASVADQVEAAAIERNDAILAVRRATLERTINGKIRKRQEQLARAENELIKRMWTSEVRNLAADLLERLVELESKRTVGVTFVAVGGGHLRVVVADHVVLEQEEDVLDVVAPVPTGGFPEPERRFAVSR